MHLARHAIILFSLLLPMLTLLSSAQTSPLSYPQPRRTDQVDDYHGTKVADPYRWLEDTDSAETHAWVEAENKLTFGYLEKIPYRQAIRDRLTKLWNYERYTIPHQEGGRYFYDHNNGLQNQNVLLVAESLIAEPRVGLGGVEASPRRIPEAEAVLTAKPPEIAIFRRAAEAAADAVDPLEDIQASAEYRRDLVRAVTRRALERAAA